MRWLPLLLLWSSVAFAAPLDLTLISDNYGAGEEDRFNVDADAIVSSLMTYEPYRTRASQLLFHRLFSTLDHHCVRDASVNRLKTCSQSLVVNDLTANHVPYKYILVVTNDSVYGGSGGTTMAVTYNGTWRDAVAVHEWGGHVIGGLHDEYNLYGLGTLYNTEQRNCWAGMPPTSWTVNPVEVCKYTNWYSDGYSVMRDITNRAFSPQGQKWIGKELDRWAGAWTPPTVTLAAMPTSGVVPLTVSFTVVATAPAGGTLSYVWSFS
jgi:hypothetical protein